MCTCAAGAAASIVHSNFVQAKFNTESIALKCNHKCWINTVKCIVCTAGTHSKHLAVWKTWHPLNTWLCVRLLLLLLHLSFDRLCKVNFAVISTRQGFYLFQLVLLLKCWNNTVKFVVCWWQEPLLNTWLCEFGFVWVCCFCCSWTACRACSALP